MSTQQSSHAPRRFPTSSSIGSVFQDDGFVDTQDQLSERRLERISTQEADDLDVPPTPEKRISKAPDRFKPDALRKASDDDGIFLDPVDLSDLPGMSKIDASLYIDLARRIPEDGFQQLVEAGYQHEIDAESPIGQCSFEPGLEHIWSKYCDMIFSQMNEGVLIECVAGNIDLAYKTSQRDGTDLASHLDKISERSKEHPSCYVRPRTDKNGDSIALEDLHELVNALRGYATQDRRADAQCCAIDQQLDEEWDMNESAKGRHWALEIATGSTSPARSKLLQIWCKAAMARYNACEKDGLPSLATPMQYVGYALHSDTRRIQHEGSSTSWLTKLVKAACAVLFADKYSFKFYVVCLIDSEDIGPWTEAILTRFMRAYATDGGFSIAWGGVSTASLRLSDYSRAERDAFWEDVIKWIKANTPLTANSQLELSRRRAYCKKLLAGKDIEIAARRAKRQHHEAFAEGAIQARELVDIDRQSLTVTNPELVEQVDVEYERVQSHLDAKRRRKDSP